MRSDVEYSPVGEGLGLREFWLYVWLRRAGVIGAHVIGQGLTLVISVISRPGTSLFSWHPMCMSAAYCLCMTEGILLLSAEGSLLCFKSRKAKVRLHWFCQALTLIIATTGLCFIVASKTVSGLPHLTSWHSVLGICTLVATFLQVVFGVCVIFSKLLRLSAPPPRLKLYHATCGLVVYLLATVTIVLAIFSDWFQAIVSGVMWWIFLLLLILPALVVMNQIINAHLPRRKVTR
ncbi:putative transmembrane reductase CYB561D1 [Pholidichthys leucotaenia]